jgi:hypothetical protein
MKRQWNWRINRRPILAIPWFHEVPTFWDHVLLAFGLFIIVSALKDYMRANGLASDWGMLVRYLARDVFRAVTRGGIS